MARDCDVVVIGAGFSGLAAARALAAAGAAPLVVEARDRVGGRVYDEPIAGGVIERGAAFVGGTQERLMELAAELGVETFPTHAEGENVVEVGGRRSRYGGTIPRLGAAATLDLGQAQLKVDRLTRRIDPAAPWDARGAARLDAESFGTWIDRNVRTGAARRLLAAAANTVWGAEPHDLSALYALAYVSGAGGLSMMLDTVGGAQHHRFRGGPQQVAERMAAELGDRVLLGTPALRVSHARDGVRVGEIAARRAIVALPPPLAARIAFDPPLPGLRDQLAQRMPMGSLAKCFAVYDQPFWRADGLSGGALSDRGPAKIVFDASPPGGAPGVLLGFVGGAEQRRLGGHPEALRRETLGGFERLFGRRAADPDAWYVQDWVAEPWTRGGPVAYMPPGVLTGPGRALREPTGPIHWAGTETSTAWAGFMDGALRAGERAAAEVLSEPRPAGRASPSARSRTPRAASSTSTRTPRRSTARRPA